MAVNPKLAALALVGVLGGCGSPGTSTPGAQVGLGAAPSPSVSVDDAPSPSISVAGVASPSVPVVGAASPSVPVVGAASPSVSVVGAADFQSPSRNITCDLTTGAVRCEIVDRKWDPPPRPAGCRLGWGHGMSIENGKASFVCAGDTVIGTATRVLPYGSSLRAGSVRCDSDTTAMRCVDDRTGSGFTLAVDDYNLF